MSVKIRRHSRGGWDVDILVLLATGDRYRERRKLNASYSKTTAREWGERRERELLLSRPKMRKEVPTLEAFAPRFIHGYARANQEKPSGIAAKPVDPAVAPDSAPRLTAARPDHHRQVLQIKRRLHETSPKTVTNVLSVLSMLLKQSVEWGVSSASPATLRR